MSVLETIQKANEMLRHLTMSIQIKIFFCNPKNKHILWYIYIYSYLYMAGQKWLKIKLSI